MSIEEADLAEAIRAGGKHIANVHLADSNRILPGYGHTDFGPRRSKHYPTSAMSTTAASNAAFPRAMPEQNSENL